MYSNYILRSRVTTPSSSLFLWQFLSRLHVFPRTNIEWQKTSRGIIEVILTHGVSRRIFGGCLRSRMSFDTHWLVCKSKNKTIQPLPNRSLKDFWPAPITTANCLIRTRFPSYIYIYLLYLFLFFWYFPHVCSSNLFSRSGEFHSNWPEFKACRSSEWLSARMRIIGDMCHMRIL